MCPKRAKLPTEYHTNRPSLLKDGDAMSSGLRLPSTTPLGSTSGTQTWLENPAEWRLISLGKSLISIAHFPAMFDNRRVTQSFAGAIVSLVLA